MPGRAIRIALAALLLIVAACDNNDASSTPFIATSREPTFSQEPVTPNDCAGTNLGTVERAPTVEEPEPPEGLQEGEEEEDDKGLGEGILPPIPVDPDAVIVNASELRPPVEPPDSVGEPQSLFVRRTDVGSDWVSGSAEPEVSTSGQTVFLTWNFGAAVSNDGGRTASSFRYFDPWRMFGASGQGRFCCDQRAMYFEHQDMWLWLLQYRALEGSDDNTIQIAIAESTGDLYAGRFHHAVWRGTDFGLAEDAFLDQSKLAITDEHFFVTINTYSQAGNKNVMLRGKIADLLAESGPLNSTCLIVTNPMQDNRQLFGVYPTRGATDVMYLGAHMTTTDLGVFRWRDDEATPRLFSVVAKNASGDSIGYLLTSPHVCPRAGAPELSDWCRRPTAGEDGWSNDTRITSAWVGNGTIGFAWNAPQNPGNGFDYPYVMAYQIDTSRLESCAAGGCVTSVDYIFDKTHAWQYASLSPNAAGDLGGVVLFGGGDEFLRCRAVVRDQFTPAGAFNYDDIAGSTGDLPASSDRKADGTREPNYARSGDYLGVTVAGNTLAWQGACMTYDKDANAFRVHVAEFGRQANDSGG